MDEIKRAARMATPEETASQREATRRIRELLSDGETHRACVVTYGCQQNEADSERIAGMLAAMGYRKTEREADADLIIVNTCAVRDHAEQKALSITGGYKHLKEKKPSLLLGICGCMVSQEAMSEKVKRSYPYIDFVFGTEMLWRLPEILYRTMTEHRRVFVPNLGAPVLSEDVPVLRESPFRAWVSIMYGCNNFCSYCIVPYVRGRERSRRPEDILAEVRGLVADGYREITLLGQNVNSYGKEWGGECDFSDLLQRICAIEGDFIVRFMTSHPKDASQKLVDTIAENPKIARQFHLPIQSGSDRILKAMNRRYTKEHYISLIRALREKIPDLSISTDVIVGFPGETEADFEETMSVLREVGYDMVFSFLYSKRNGTPAAEMADQVPESVKSARCARLLAQQNEIALEKNQRTVGKMRRVLTEGRSKTNDALFTGRDTGNKIVLFEAEERDIGTFVNVRITEAQAFALYGKIERSDPKEGTSL